MLLRRTSRSLLFGSWKRLHIDDMIMVFALVRRSSNFLTQGVFGMLIFLLIFLYQCTYTVLVASINIVAVTDTNLMLPETIPKLTPESIKSRIFGSKMVLILEQCMILLPKIRLLMLS